MAWWMALDRLSAEEAFWSVGGVSRASRKIQGNRVCRARSAGGGRITSEAGGSHPEAAMQEIVSKLGSEEVLGLVAIVGAFASALTLGTLGILLGFYRQTQETRRAESLNAIKQDMIGRGISSEDIVAVLAAGIPDKKGRLLRCG